MYQHPEDQNYEVDYTGVYPDDSQYYWDDAEGEEEEEEEAIYSLTPRQTRSGSDTEREGAHYSDGSGGNMSSRSSKSGSPPTSRPRASSSRTKKSDDWSDVTEPEERRRIQNRIAQRKFREKAREQRDRAQRDAQNQQFAGSAYHIAGPEELAVDDGGSDLSGLPWGGLNMRHVVARGHAAAGASAAAHTSAHSAESDHYGGGGGGGGHHHSSHHQQQQFHHGGWGHQGTAVMYGGMNAYTSAPATAYSAVGVMPMGGGATTGTWPSPDMSAASDVMDMAAGGGFYDSPYGGGYDHGQM